ncbi:hypothetical protein B0H14DRAFT_2842719 [Mycena olivaceomarginata]|nr:hypothetical protein B0H14DRAFT_2842719 [Mycena olivaceomarginata]
MSDSKEHVASSFDNHRRGLILGILIPGIVLSAMVLIAFAYTAWQRRSRPHLHRVSFRLLIYATVSNFILSVTLIPTETLMTGPISAAACTFAVFASNTSLLFSAGMYFCMALNLQLVLVHGVNGLKMENTTWVLTTAPAGTTTRIPRLICAGVVGTLSFWIFLMASSELVCFFVLVSYMLRRQMSVKRMRAGISAEMSTLQHAAYSAAPILQFRGIILRITLYPLLSCALNFSSSILALYLANHLGNTELISAYSTARPFLYAVLAATRSATTSQSLIRAVSALRQPAIAGRRGTQRGAGSQLRSQSSRSSTSGPQQTDPGTHNTHTHRDPEQGTVPDSSVVQSREDSIEFQI